MLPILQLASVELTESITCTEHQSRLLLLFKIWFRQLAVQATVPQACAGHLV